MVLCTISKWGLLQTYLQFDSVGVSAMHSWLWPQNGHIACVLGIFWKYIRTESKIFAEYMLIIRALIPDSVV